MARAWKWLACLAVAASPWLIGLGHPLLYDDIGMIAENEFLAEPANWTQAATGRTLLDPQVVNGRRPAVLATFFLDRAWHGLQPSGWRFTSLLLHLGCAGLWMLLLRRLGAGDFVIAGAGLLFALHPAGVEAVHAPGFRADVLCLLFMLAALHGFLTARRRMVAGMMSGALFSALALLSKETALALPLLLAVLPGLFPQAFPTGRRAAAAVAVCAAVSAAFFALWAFLPTDLQALGGSWNGESLRFPDNLYSLPAVWGRTVRYLLAPWPLNVTPSFEPVRSMASWRFWGGAVLAAGWGWAAWRLRRTRPWLSFGLIWAAALFLPVSNLIPLLHPVADRYLYPMTPGIAVAAAWGLSRWPRPARGAVLALLAALCAGLVVVRIGEWESGERLWTRAYERNPRSATAAVWLGLLREEAGDPAGAREWYARAAEANPREAAAWINWGILEGRQGAWPESERLLRRALDVRPESAKARHNLAVCLERQGRLAEAKALRGDQGSPNP